MVTVNELFSGIGAQVKALKRAGINYKVIGVSEIDDYAIASYEAIHGKVKNYGDISKIPKLDYADLWTYSFPCQDISKAGRLAGISTNTRSGLLYEVQRLLDVSKEESELPKYLLLENVAMLVSKRFKKEFLEWLEYLDNLGYNTTYSLINASKYGVPQNRVRVFAVSVLKSEGKIFEFPPEVPLRLQLEDIIEECVDDRYYINPDRYKNVLSFVGDKVRAKVNTKLGYSEMSLGGICKIDYPNSYNKRGRIQGGGRLSPTLMTTDGGVVFVEKSGRVRRLTALEFWRFMGFDDEDYYRAASTGISETQLKKNRQETVL